MSRFRKYVAIIPARGGSKRLPRKNVLPLAGKPLIGWTIEAALECEQLEKVVVSSDDNEIISIARNYPVITLKRPDELATDIATSFDVVKHIVEKYSDYEYAVLLQPTSPLRTGKHIQEAINLLEAKKADAVITVCKTEHSPLWANTLPENMSMEGFLSADLLNKQGQSLPVYYRLNGAIYICNIEKLLEYGSFFLKENIYALVMDDKYSIDIDTEIDFKFAEMLKLHFL